MLVATGVAFVEVEIGSHDVADGVATVDERTMVAVAEAQYSRPRALSSPRQAWRSQAHATSGTPEATQDLYVSWQGSWRRLRGPAEMAEVRARATARVLQYILKVVLVDSDAVR
jgi:hypothetical protein